MCVCVCVCVCMHIHSSRFILYVLQKEKEISSFIQRQAPYKQGYNLVYFLHLPKPDEMGSADLSGGCEVGCVLP